MTLTQAHLLEVLIYDPNTGLFRWKSTKSKRISIGDVAGSFTANGYIQIRFDGCIYLAHRLAVLYMTGRWPETLVDHRDRVRSNNRWSNIREASYSENAGNMATRPSNTSGYKGVFFRKESPRPFAQIMVDGRSIYLGTFDTPEDAAMAYQAAAIEYFGEFARAA